MARNSNSPNHQKIINLFYWNKFKAIVARPKEFEKSFLNMFDNVRGLLTKSHNNDSRPTSYELPGLAEDFFLPHRQSDDPTKLASDNLLAEKS